MFKLPAIFLLSFFFVIIIFHSAEASPNNNIIVEKNLFHPERKKWMMEYRENKKSKIDELRDSKKKKSSLASIVLYGTIITGIKEYAVLQTDKRNKRSKFNNLYMVGDYVNGYLIKEIEEKNIVLADTETDEYFKIFLNESRDRQSAKTPIREERKISGKYSTRGNSPGNKAIKSRNPKKAKTATMLNNRLKRDLMLLKKRQSKLIKKQAGKDYNELEKLLPFMSNKDRIEFIELKREYMKLKN